VIPEWRIAKGATARSVAGRRERTRRRLKFRCVRAWVSVSLGLVALALCARAAAQTTVLELDYTPVTRAQVALWVEDADGQFLATVALTEAVAYRGIGNRPGASELNSGYRWPYGRREGVLPIWAHRRAAASGVQLFPRVIYQGRPEGWASRLMFDQSPDAYYCLQFDPTHSTRDELDAVSCATVFNSDKGRYLTADDVSHGYAEPFEDPGGVAGSRQLPMQSLYPPRLDVTRCNMPGTCYDHADVDHYAADARAAMPEIDSVTKATPPGDTAQRVLFSVPSSWPSGVYHAWIEVNVEGDYNDHWNATRFPTPRQPPDQWDPYGYEYGYPYRGQPSLAYEVAFVLDGTAGAYGTDTAAGRSSWDVWSDGYGQLEPISTDPSDDNAISTQGGSGIDRLRAGADGKRFTVRVAVDGDDAANQGDRDPIGAIAELRVSPDPDKLHSHAWAQLHFLAAVSEAPIHEYEVRVATAPITDEASFLSLGRPAKNATEDAEGATALMLPADTPAGQPIDAKIGDLTALTHYFIGVRATDAYNRHGPITVTELMTTERTFATVTPCFIATAAYGSPLAHEVSALRRVRDRDLLSTEPGRALVAAYYAWSPYAASVMERHAWLKPLVRAALWPLTAAAAQLR
jgi:hypothetical protein